MLIFANEVRAGTIRNFYNLIGLVALPCESPLRFFIYLIFKIIKT